MNSNQSRREAIMNSEAQLPGDRQRANDESNEDFDALDTGNFGDQPIDDQRPNIEREQQINRSKEQLPGDLQRADDDQRVDEGGHNTGHGKPQGQHAPSLSAQDLGNELDDGTKTGGKTVDG